MKIGILSDDYLPALGGAELYAYNLAKFLNENGHEATIFTFAPSDGGPERSGIKVVRVPWSWKPAKYFHFWKMLLGFAKEQDILHTIDSYKIGFYSTLASMLKRKPLFNTTEGRGILDLPGENWKFKMVHDMYRASTLKRAYANIHACWEFDRIGKRIAPKNRHVYMPNPVDDIFFKTDSSLARPSDYPQGKKIILTVRRLVPKNGIQYLVRALPEIRRRIPEVHYLAIGTGRAEEAIKKLAVDLGVADIITFKGAVKNEELRPYISHADVVVFPSSAEATSLACTEVLASGKAVVASSIGGYPELIEDGKNGLLVKLFDREDSDYDAPFDLPQERIDLITEAVCKILGDDALRADLGRNARERIEKEFSWRVNGPKIVALYRESLAGK
ncbi:glycosyltransferase family 4 protein [Candidatus Uhrbacteria bacterium]|nr:glycosyltransferase family 4 protein [Candidatus Uhrbacteria bacterium]